MTKDLIIDYLQEHKEEFFKKYQISKLALFGSYSRNENRKDSDVDIAIETPISDYFLLYDFLHKRRSKKLDSICMKLIAV